MGDTIDCSRIGSNIFLNVLTLIFNYMLHQCMGICMSVQMPWNWSHNWLTHLGTCSGPQEEQHVLLTTEQSLQALNVMLQHNP